MINLQVSVLAWAVCLAGCAAQQQLSCPEPIVHNVPYEVKVPVYLQPKAPGDLLRPYVPTEYPAFLQPDDSAAKYGLTELDWQRLQVILRTMKTRDDAWRAWAVKPVTGATPQ